LLPRKGNDDDDDDDDNDYSLAVRHSQTTAPARREVDALGLVKTLE